MTDARSDAFEALAALEGAISTTVDDLLTARDRVKQLLDMKDDGQNWSTIVSGEERPLVVELLTRSLMTLSEAGGRFRRAEALALHLDGLAMARIADLFGVSRQRISSLLSNQKPGPALDN